MMELKKCLMIIYFITYTPRSAVCKTNKGKFVFIAIDGFFFFFFICLRLSFEWKAFLTFKDTPLTPKAWMIICLKHINSPHYADTLPILELTVEICRN
jgi:hypothetical protein